MSLKSYLGKLELKDKLTILVSAAALLISILASVNSVFQARSQERQALSNQLSDTLKQITDIAVEIAKVTHDAGGDPAYYGSQMSPLTNKQEFLRRQAIYLAAEAPSDLVSDAELKTVADSCVAAGDFRNADKFYRQAIETARDSASKSTAFGSHANFLFTIGKFEEGRDEFKKAITVTEGNDNMSRQERATAYEFWGASEEVYAHSPKRANELFDDEKGEIEGIDIVPEKNAALQHLEWARNNAAVALGAPANSSGSAPVMAPPSAPQAGGAALVAPPEIIGQILDEQKRINSELQQHQQEIENQRMLIEQIRQARAEGNN